MLTTFLISIMQTTFVKRRGQMVQQETLICEGEFSIAEALMAQGKAKPYSIPFTYKSRVKANLTVDSFSIRQPCTFLDLYGKNSLNIVPIIAIDFSMANLNFDDMGQWTGTFHSLKGDNNDYTSCLASV